MEIWCLYSKLVEQASLPSDQKFNKRKRRDFVILNKLTEFTCCVVLVVSVVCSFIPVIRRVVYFWNLAYLTSTCILTSKVVCNVSRSFTKPSLRKILISMETWGIFVLGWWILLKLLQIFQNIMLFKGMLIKLPSGWVFVPYVARELVSFCFCMTQHYKFYYHVQAENHRCFLQKTYMV